MWTPALEQRLDAVSPGLSRLHPDRITRALEAAERSLLSLDPLELEVAAQALVEFDDWGERLADLGEEGLTAEAAALLPGSSVDEGMLVLADDHLRLLERATSMRRRVEATRKKQRDDAICAGWTFPRHPTREQARLEAERLFAEHPVLIDELIGPMPGALAADALREALAGGDDAEDAFLHARLSWSAGGGFPQALFERAAELGSLRACQCLHYFSKGVAAATWRDRAIDAGDTRLGLARAEELFSDAANRRAGFDLFVRTARMAPLHEGPTPRPLILWRRVEMQDAAVEAAFKALGWHAVRAQPLSRADVEMLVGLVRRHDLRRFEKIARLYGMSVDQVIGRATRQPTI